MKLTQKDNLQKNMNCFQFFNSLSIDVGSLICTYLNTTELLNMKIINKLWKQISSKPSSWCIHSIETNISFSLFSSNKSTSFMDTLYQIIQVSLSNLSSRRSTNPNR
jgi:hypothetical protein